jgi:DNA-directed RNA polymerase subunit RPC12/RpoP
VERSDRLHRTQLSDAEILGRAVFKTMIRVQQWWTNGRPEATSPYEIICHCGKVSRGQRDSRHQTIACPACGRKLFVLPRSPFAPGSSSAVSPLPVKNSQNPAPVPPVARVNPWVWPVVAGSLTLAIASALMVLLLSHLQSQRPTLATTPAWNSADVDGHLQAARRAIDGSDFKRAAEDLQAVQSMLRQQPELLPAVEARRLAHLERQVALVADWPREPLEQILTRVGKLNPREWEAVVRGYRGQAVLLDVVARRDPAGRYHVDNKHPAGEATLRLELQNLRVLQSLPLADPQRLLLGARLAEIRREGAGSYLVQFEPDSGVLLTDADLAGKCVLQPLDESMHEVLRRQAGWVAARQ